MSKFKAHVHQNGLEMVSAAQTFWAYLKYIEKHNVPVDLQRLRTARVGDRVYYDLYSYVERVA